MIPRNYISLSLRQINNSFLILITATADKTHIVFD